MTSTRARGAAAPALLAASLGGAAALADEIVWIRLLALELGATAPALALVLSTFFAGLALGSAAAARVASRLARANVAYSVAEGAIGVLAVVSPAALARFGAVALLPPTFFMGATLPLLAAAARASGRGASRLYAANTLGGAAGAAIAGFVAIEAIGMHATIRAAAAANVLAAALGAFLRERGGESSEPEAPLAAASLRGGVVLALAALVGAASIAGEVVLNRLLYQVLGGTTYAVTATLAVYLAAIAAGSAAAAWAWPRLRDSRAAVAFGLAALGATTLLAPRVLLALSTALRIDAIDHLSLAAGAWRSAVVAIAVLAPPALASGFLFPLLLRARGGDASAALGLVYAVNTAAAIAAAAAATFLAVPSVGLSGTLAIAGVVVLLAGIACLRGAAARAIGAALLLGAFAAKGSIPAASMRLWLYGALETDERAPSDGGTSERAVFHREGVSATVTVTETTGPRGTTLDFAINGKKEASTDPGGMRNQLALGHLPMLLHPAPRRALVVGLGAGVTAGAVSVHPGVDVVIAELAPEVPDATRRFAEANHSVLDRANVTVRIEDGRRTLARNPGAFDVVTSDPVHPWVAGAANLYTAEYFVLVRDALAAGGVAAHWLPLYEMRVDETRIIVASFAAAFPRAAVWFGPGGDAVLVGAKDPLRADLADVARRASASDVASDLRRIGIRDPLRLLAGIAAGPALADGAPLHTDDRPILEFRAARTLYLPSTVGANLTYLAERAWSGNDLAAFLGATGAALPRLDALLAANVAATRAKGLVFDRAPGAADAAIEAWVREPDGEQIRGLLDAPGLEARLAHLASAREAFVAGAVEARRGEVERAVATLRLALAKPDCTADVERAIRRQLAVVLGETRAYADALDALAPALERAPDDPALLRLGSRLLDKLGRADEARAWRERARPLDLRLGPETPEDGR
ncbi:MAG TPA: fused MFS/spermidine synthase [Planctomycetota bacterium]|nr:fused MFS/spermidine synthase [Planctomycetota bacterium]